MEFRHLASAVDLSDAIKEFIKSIGGTLRMYKGPDYCQAAFEYDGVFLYIKVVQTMEGFKAVAHSKIFKVVDGYLTFSKADLDKLASKNSDERTRVRRLQHTIQAKLNFLKLWLETEDQTVKTTQGFGIFTVYLELHKTKDYAFVLRLKTDVTRQTFLDTALPDILYTGDLLFTRINSSGRSVSNKTDEKSFTVKKPFSEWKQFSITNIQKSIDDVFNKINPELEKRVAEIAEHRARIQQLELEISELNFSVATVVDQNIKLLT